MTVAALNRWRLAHAEQTSPHWREHDRRVRWAFLFYDPVTVEAKPGCGLQMDLFDPYDCPPLSAAEVWHPLGKE